MNTAKGARGPSALRAAAETEILVEGDQDRRTATVTKQRDGEDNLTFAFRLEHVEIDGNLIATSCILEPLSDWKPSTAKAAPSRKLSDRQKNALTVLTDMVVDGNPLPGAWGLPAGLKGVSVESWEATLQSRGAIDKNGANPRQDFRRLKDALISRKLMGERDGLVWKV